MIITYQQKREIGWLWQSIDSKSCPSPLGGEQTGRNPTDRGKQDSKIHLLVDEKGAIVLIYSHLLMRASHNSFFAVQKDIWGNASLSLT
jgi:hypothetical protein